MNLMFLIATQSGALRLVHSSDYDNIELVYAVMLMVWGGVNIAHEWIITLTGARSHRLKMSASSVTVTTASAMAHGSASNDALKPVDSAAHEVHVSVEHEQKDQPDPQQHDRHELKQVHSSQSTVSQRGPPSSHGGLVPYAVGQQPNRGRVENVDISCDDVSCCNAKDMDACCGLWGNNDSLFSLLPSEQGQAAFMGMVCACVIGAGCIMLTQETGGWLAVGWWSVFALLDGVWYVNALNYCA